MMPLRQGRLDNLCGLYAIINALDLVGLEGPRRPLHGELFRRLIRAIPADELADAVNHGLEPYQIMAAGSRTFRWLKREHGISLMIDQPLADHKFESVDECINGLRVLSSAPLTALIISIDMPGAGHWTVVRSIKGEHARVRDSTTLKILDLTRFGLKGGGYRLRASETLIIRRQLQHRRPPLIKPR